MAKIALICRDITPSVLNWAEGLAQQKHQVRILTSRQISWAGTSPLPMQLYFKKWSVLEALRLIPSLTKDLPEIFHFVFQTDDDNASPAHWALASFAQSLGRRVACSLMTEPDKKWKWNPFLKTSDGVSFETRESLMIAKRSGFISPQQKAEVILPMLKGTPIEEVQHWRELASIMGRYILIAGPPTREKLEILQAALIGMDIHPVFAGPRLANSLKASPLPMLSYTALHENSLQAFASLLPQSLGLVLCLHDFEPSELVQWHQLCLLHRAPVWVRQDQQDSLPGLCRNGKTGFILEPKAQLLRRSLENPLPRWESQVQQNHPLEMADESLNALNRFYAAL